jgi:hypothetical protein
VRLVLDVHGEFYLGRTGLRGVVLRVRHGVANLDVPPRVRLCSTDSNGFTDRGWPLVPSASTPVLSRSSHPRPRP